MQDIGNVLARIMQDEQCTPIRAFCLLTEEREENVRELQPKSGTKISRRLCNTGNIEKFR